MYTCSVDNVTLLARQLNNSCVVWTATTRSDNLGAHRTSVEQNCARPGVVLRTSQSRAQALATLKSAMQANDGAPGETSNNDTSNTVFNRLGDDLLERVTNEVTNKLAPEDLSKLQGLPQLLPHITVLDLPHITNSEQLNELVNMIGQLPNLQRLNLSGSCVHRVHKTDHVA
jgi:hypothetical protein